MSDFVPRDSLPELWKEILQRHWTYLDTEESMQKLEERKKLEGCLKEFLRIVPHDRKFFLPETAHVLKESIKQMDDFSAYKAMNGSESISQYANNLFSKPWRKEYRVIKIEKKRIREKNWDELEKQLLLSLIDQNSIVIEDKRNDVKLIPKKKAAWSNICGQMAAAGYTRTQSKIKDQWHRMKIAARKSQTLSRKTLKATGNIIEIHQPTEFERQIQGIIGKELEDDIIIDSNSILYLGEEKSTLEKGTSKENVVETHAIEGENDIVAENTSSDAEPSHTQRIRNLPKVESSKKDVLSERQNQIKLEVIQSKEIYEVRVEIEKQKLLQIKNQMYHEKILFEKDNEIKELKIKILTKELSE